MRATHKTESKEDCMRCLQTVCFYTSGFFKYLCLNHFGINDYKHLITMWVPSLANFIA